MNVKDLMECMKESLSTVDTFLGCYNECTSLECHPNQGFDQLGNCLNSHDCKLYCFDIMFADNGYYMEEDIYDEGMNYDNAENLIDNVDVVLS